MSDFDKEVCAVCGAECIRLADGICQTCYLDKDFAHSELASGIGEELGDRLDKKFAMLWRIIRAQGDRIKSLENALRELRKT